METTAQIAARLGLTVEQVEEIKAQAIGGTVASRSVWTPEELAARKAARAKETAELAVQWKAASAARSARKIAAAARKAAR